MDPIETEYKRLQIKHDKLVGEFEHLKEVVRKGHKLIDKLVLILTNIEKEMKKWKDENDDNFKRTKEHD